MSPGSRETSARATPGVAATPYGSRTSTARLPPPVQQLLETQLDSFEKLELVLVLHAAPARSATLVELARQLQFPQELVGRIVYQLAETGLVQVDGGTAHFVERPGQRAALDELRATYDDDRVLIVTTLSEIAMKRIRGMAARTFADAFRLRKKRGDDDG